MSITVLGGSPFPYLPYSNITPFIVRDGSTYLSVLEELRSYIRDTLVPEVDKNIGDLSGDYADKAAALISAVNQALSAQATQVEGYLSDQDDDVAEQVRLLTEYVNGEVSKIINATISVSDTTITAVFDNLSSVFRSRLTGMFAPKANPTFTGTVTGVTKSHVGLANVDNTTDLLKPVSTATGTAIGTASTADRTRSNHTGTQAASTISDFGSAASAAVSISGTFANRPAATAVPSGTLYYPTNVPEQYRSNGTNWITIGSGGNELGYAERLATFTTTTLWPALADVTGLSVTITAGDRPYYVEAGGSGIGASVVGSRAIFGIAEGSTILTYVNHLQGVNGAVVPNGVAHKRISATPGSVHTYKVVAAVTSASTMTAEGSTPQPMWLRVVNI